MKRLLHLLVLIAGLIPALSAQVMPPFRGELVVSANRHYLQKSTGEPFFWLGDTGWELFHRLTKEEIKTYIENRSSKGFNVIQAVILAEFDGLRKPNRYGELPFEQLDPSRPNDKYFALVDWTVQLAAGKAMYMGLLPTWGDKVTKLWGEGPVVFTEASALKYGIYLGNRYKSYSNIIWILGGDRPAKTDTVDWTPIWRAMAKGIREGGDTHSLITFHTWGGSNSTSQQIHNEPWLDINMMQSGHGSGHDVPVWDWIKRDRALIPVKPTLDAEPNYEDHPVNPWPKWDPANGYFNDYDVRKQLYRSVFAGACGVTYGHHAIWQFWSPREEKINHADRYWTEALDRPGAFQAGYLRKLIESRPSLNRVPDDGIIESNGEKGQHGTAFRLADSTALMVYSPSGTEYAINTDGLKNEALVIWLYEPVKGKAIKLTSLKSNPGFFRGNLPDKGKENDWVIVVDVQSASYPEPGKK